MDVGVEGRVDSQQCHVDHEDLSQHLNMYMVHAHGAMRRNPHAREKHQRASKAKSQGLEPHAPVSLRMLCMPV